MVGVKAALCRPILSYSFASPSLPTAESVTRHLVMFSDARREPRYRVADPKRIVAHLKSDDQHQSVEILDISRGGLRLRIGEFVPQDARVELEITVDVASVHAVLRAQVCRVEADRGGWVIGCIVNPKLESKVMSELALSGVLERRRDRRRPLSFPAEAKTRLASGFEDMLIVNVSAGGFCAKFDKCIAESNDRLLIRIQDESNGEEQLLQARVAWAATDDDGGQTIGCSFLTKSDFAKLQSVAEADRVGNPLFHLSGNAGTRWSIVATGLMLIVVVVQQIFIVQQLLR